MSKDKSTRVDYLSEDPEISGQKYALVSIVGPHLPQKCDVYGLKVRGVADSVAEAKQMTKRLMKFDNMYDIYTVSVGKFFPLNVEPYDVKEVEHNDEKLNELMKSYLKNREDANEHYHHRKQEMMEKAIKEGTKERQAELANQPEHPIAVLQRKQTFEEKAAELREQLMSLEKDIELTVEKYSGYTEEERVAAEEEVRKALEKQQKVIEPSHEDSFSNIKDEIANELKEEIEQQQQQQQQEHPLKSVLEQLNVIETDIKEVYDDLSEINKVNSPNAFERLSNKLNTLEAKREELKSKLNDKKLVNEYVNKGFNGSDHDSLFQ
jgi:uncharacterized phage infection (PIP) family protein YhgE